MGDHLEIVLCLTTQVKGLRPGKSYSFRLEARFELPEDAHFEIAEMASSEIVSFSTPATVPSEPRHISLGNKASNSLIVSTSPVSLHFTAKISFCTVFQHFPAII